MTDTTREAFSVRDFRRWAGIGRTKALKEISDGGLRAGKAGRKVLIPTSAAYAWLDGLRRRQRHRDKARQQGASGRALEQVIETIAGAGQETYAQRLYARYCDFTRTKGLLEKQAA